MKIFCWLWFCLLLLTPAWAQEEGRIYCVYVPAKTPFGRTMEKALTDTHGFDQLTAAMTKVFKLPRDLPLVFGETGKVNAWYDGTNHRIVMSYELMEFLARLFAKEAKSPDDVGNLVAGTTMFTLFHELGHALIGELDLPVTGREEDCADEFATLLLNSFGEQGQDWVFSAASWFQIMARNRGNQEFAFWDEHSLDEQRYYDIFTMVYGSDPVKYHLIEQIVPAARLRRAVADYKKKDRNWNRLLAPYVRSEL